MSKIEILKFIKVQEDIMEV